MALQTNKKEPFLAVITNLSRIALAVVLIISGFVKAVDPMGLCYKLEEYLAAFGVESITPGWLMLVAILLCAAEFITGVLLLMGVYRRLVVTVTFLFFLFFTPLTLVLALWNPVRDCGCFGDAIQLSNWATFAKNVVLLILATIVVAKRRLFVGRISLHSRWMVLLFAVSYVAILQGFALLHLPVIDFRPFAIGTNLREAVVDVPSEKRVLYKFEREGVVREFDEESYPDSTWNYLGSREEILKEGVPAKILDFSFIDDYTGDEYADIILSDTGYVCLLIVEDTETADESRVDKINDIYDLCCEHGAAFYAATASQEDNVLRWRKRTGAEYPILWADPIMLKTIVRANPGLLLIKDGVVLEKWNATDIPEIEKISVETTFSSLKTDGYIKTTRQWHFWLLLFVCPLMLIAAIDAVVRKKAKNKEKKAGDKNEKKSKKQNKK
ncbi:MAG: DoxX family protein [Bacteroidaceae bacterium]|nr:DoxX family protein [Bacteroidaceae bacterium]